MISRKKILLGLLCVCSGTYAAIEEFNFSDSHGLGMSGAYSASANGSAAILANPAALGFMMRDTDGTLDNTRLGEQNFGWRVLNLGLGATLTGDLGDYLQVLADTDFTQFQSPLLQQPDNVRSLLALAGTLGSVSDNDTILVNANAGTLMQIGGFGIGIRTFGQIGGWINDLDLINLGLQVGADQLADELRGAMVNDGFNPIGYTPQILSGESIVDLRDAFGGSATNDDVVAYLDYKMVELVDQNNLNAGNVKEAADILADIITASGVGSALTDNETSITGRGFIAVEMPVSYGYALNENFAIGMTARVIFGRVYGTQVWAFSDNNEQILEDTIDSSVDRVNLGLDAAMMYRIPKWHFALVGHNLNRPRFDGYQETYTINGAPQTVQVPDVVLDPQVSAAAAWIPVRRLILSTELELLETQTLLNNYDMQRVSFGSSLDLSLLTLRLGTYRNIAEADLGWVLTGGAGFRLWALSFDLGAAVSIDDTVNYDGTELPRTVRLNASVSMDL